MQVTMRNACSFGCVGLAALPFLSDEVIVYDEAFIRRICVNSLQALKLPCNLDLPDIHRDRSWPEALLRWPHSRR